MKKRKLIRPDVLERIYDDVQQGVPVAKAMRKHLGRCSDQITRPSVVKILLTRSGVEANSPTQMCEIVASVVPNWLDAKGLQVQEQPDDWEYLGYFPTGEWVQICKQ